MATRQADVPRGLGLTSSPNSGMIELTGSPTEDNQFHLFKTQAQQRAEEEQDTVNRRAMFHRERAPATGNSESGINNLHTDMSIMYAFSSN